MNEQLEKDLADIIPYPEPDWFRGAWERIARLARLGATVEAMPEGAQLRHRHGGRWMLYPDYADTLNLNSGATPQEALDKFKRALESTGI